ncbi:MAG: hypothetical protein IPN26_05350 [Bacteroidetes bacterium]|nr:hypothetical protein [Bacteroidota bacterium]
MAVWISIFSPASYLIASFDTSHFDYFIAKYNANGVFQWVNQYAYGGGFVRHYHG